MIAINTQYNPTIQFGSLAWCYLQLEKINEHKRDLSKKVKRVQSLEEIYPQIIRKINEEKGLIIDIRV